MVRRHRRGLSPIENLWAWLDKQCRDARCDSIVQLKAVVEKALYSDAGRATAKRLCQGFAGRLEKVIESEGKNIRCVNPRLDQACPGAGK